MMIYPELLTDFTSKLFLILSPVVNDLLFEYLCAMFIKCYNFSFFLNV